MKRTNAFSVEVVGKNKALFGKFRAWTLWTRPTSPGTPDMQGSAPGSLPTCRVLHPGALPTCRVLHSEGIPTCRVLHSEVIPTCRVLQRRRTGHPIRPFFTRSRDLSPQQQTLPLHCREVTIK